MMTVITEPSVEFQTAVRAQLIASPGVTALVRPELIRAGWHRPDGQPCVIMSNAQTEFLGQASGSQHCARVYLDLNIWAIEGGPETAKAIGWQITQSLIGFTGTADLWVDQFDQPRVTWLRDPQPELTYTHGVMSLEAVIRWKF
jgi:hypothetical protein